MNLLTRNTLTRNLCTASISALALMSSISIAQTGATTEPTKQTQPTGHEGHNHGTQNTEPTGHEGHNHGTQPTQLDHIEAGLKRTAPTGDISDNLAQSIMVFKSISVSTGDILDTEPADIVFEFKNTGLEDLEIRLIKPSCGCTVPEMEKKIYEPGEKGTIKITFDPSGKKGSISRNITIYTNSETKPVVLTRPRILSFDMTRKGQSRTQDIKVYGRFPEFKVTRATVPDSENFSVEVVDGGEVDIDGDTMWLQTLRVTLRQSAKPKSHRTEISVRTNEKNKPIFSLPVVGRVIGDLELSPVRMTIGRLVVGDSFEREITVKSNSGKAFEIKSVNSSNVVLEAQYSAQPVDAEKRNEWTIKVNGTVTHPAQRFNAQINVVTDVVDEELMTVQMYGQLQPKSTP